MNKVIIKKKEENDSFDSSALRAKKNIEVYSIETLAHHGVRGMKWGIRKDRESGSRTGKRAEARAARREKKDIVKTLKTINRNYTKIHNKMADESEALIAPINAKYLKKYGQDFNAFNKSKESITYWNDVKKTLGDSLNKHSASILKNKVNFTKYDVSWEFPHEYGGFPIFVVSKKNDNSEKIKHAYSEENEEERQKIDMIFDRNSGLLLRIKAIDEELIEDD